MAVDLSRLSDDDLMALKSGDLSKVSTAGLMHLRGSEAQRPKMAEPAFEREAREIASTTPAELIAANPMARVAVAAARPFLGAADLVERTWGGTSNRDRLRQLEEMQRRGNQALGLGAAGTVSDVAGAVVSPVVVAASKLPQAAGAVQKAVQGGEIGALAGLTAGGDNPLQDAGIGAPVGAVAPGAIDLAGKAGRTAYRVAIEPWARPAAIKGRAYLEAAGDKADEIISLLRQNREIVPGSRPTAGQAAVPAGRAEFAALQDSAAKVDPSAYLARSDQQNAARLAAVRSVGQDKAALSSAEGTRAANAAQNYAAVADDVVVPADDSIKAILGRPSMEKAIERAKVLASEQGGTFAGVQGGVTVRNMQNIKMAMDDMLKSPEQFGLGASEAKAIGETRTQFVRWLNQKSPGWERARTQFATDSAPINQMKVGQELEEKLIPALSEEAKQTATTFAGAMRNAPRTLKSATGQPRYQELSEVLTPQQLGVVQSVQDDLARLSRFGTMAQAGRGSAAASEVASASMEQAVGGKVRLGILDRAAMIANTLITRAEGKINKKLASEIAVEMMNPPKVAESMAAAAKRRAQNEAVARTVERVRLGGTVAGVQAAEN